MAHIFQNAAAALSYGLVAFGTPCPPCDEGSTICRLLAINPNPIGALSDISSRWIERASIFDAHKRPSVQISAQQPRGFLSIERMVTADNGVVCSQTDVFREFLIWKVWSSATRFRHAISCPRTTGVSWRVSLVFKFQGEQQATANHISIQIDIGGFDHVKAGNIDPWSRLSFIGATAQFERSLSLPQRPDNSGKAESAKDRCDYRPVSGSPSLFRCFLSSDGGAPLSAQIGGVVTLGLVAGVGIVSSIWGIGIRRRLLSGLSAA